MPTLFSQGDPFFRLNRVFPTKLMTGPVMRFGAASTLCRAKLPSDTVATAGEGNVHFPQRLRQSQLPKYILETDN